jgi:GrpB-like predicted nucleotidyltransferase (UPF0157 family)/GNAT superfamily N-acetyltransferase
MGNMALSTTFSREPAAAQDDRFWIREASTEDTVSVLRIIHAAYAEFQDKLDPPSGAHAETEATIRKLFDSERCAIAGWGTEVAGCTFFHIGERDTYLHRLAVVPQHRRKAIGHALVTYVETQARAGGSPRVRLGVRLQLPTNQVFYRSLGYSVTSHHSHPGYSYPTYVSMTKDVSEPPQRVIEVVAPNPIWSRQYEVEAQLLRLVFGSQLVEIHHIGSTSIAGIYAKPIIDMLPLVRDIEVVDSYNPIMAALGYKAWGEFGLTGRRYFSRGTTLRTHQAHIYQIDDPDAGRHLAFRDYLRAHPDKALVYSDHKRAVARQHPYDIYAYMDAKDALVKQLEAEALEWQREGTAHDVHN